MKTRKRAATGFGLTLAILFLFALFLNLNFHTVIVDGQSMLPTLAPGQRVVVSKAYWLVGAIHNKDIVVIKDPTGTGYIIKRVFRMGGEQVPIDKWPEFRKLETGTYIVPKEEVYVLGDNLGESEDSRKFGPVGVDKIIGKVVVRP
jgi:signal peptidase I